MPKVRDDNYCFVCGRNNPIGLKLSFDLDLTEKTVTTVFRPDRIHQGWTDRLHGGILMAVMDEVMVNASYLMDMQAVTGQISIRFRAAANTRQKLTLVGRITEIRSTFLKAKAECKNENDELIAEADAILVRVLE